MNYHIFIDESGNTGHNLFDKNQPYFWVSAIMVKENCMESVKNDIALLKSSLNTNELHGNELGLRFINQASGELINIFKQLNAKFLFVRINKPHIATMKFVDCLIDSENNPAIPPLYYYSKSTRYMLAQPIAALFNEDSQKEFWNIYKRNDTQAFKTFLCEFKVAVNSYIPDPRLREILNDAVEFAINHPTDILDVSYDNYESPNLVSMSLLLQGVKDILPNKYCKISKIIHDEQNQFAKYLKEMFNMLRGISIKYKLVGNPDVTVDDVITGEIEFEESTNSDGLQLIDVAMWILKQEVDKKKKIESEAGLLLEFIKKNGFISQFSFETLTYEAHRAYENLMSQPFTEDQLELAKERVKQLESQRKHNLSSS
ncbi:DUF3800 domain-containing protein [Shouchella clausii]|uniref:DUF3800 domain-containing protein n=1 Tax=Shouchella clausii TaxID=79880 RepID=UPI0015C73CA8|nr:DUF3800 domain-containing protein [Shouchella clausii]